MSKNKFRIKTLFVIYLILIHLTAGYLIYDKYFNAPPIMETKTTQPVSPLSTPLELPSQETELRNAHVQIENKNTANVPVDVASANVNANSKADTNTNFGVQTSNAEKLLIPVVGIKKSDLRDTYNDARSEGRVHNAIDIMANGGTPVVAAADGEIAKFFDSKLGGITIYQFSVDKKRVYYYAHLQKRADNLTEHEFVKQGAVIGYVGDTGNAGAGNYHLHFEISLLNDPKKYWEAAPINPYPILKDGIESR